MGISERQRTADGDAGKEKRGHAAEHTVGDGSNQPRHLRASGLSRNVACAIAPLHQCLQRVCVTTSSTFFEEASDITCCVAVLRKMENSCMRPERHHVRDSSNVDRSCTHLGKDAKHQ